jgi:hypothetical protein
MGVEYWLRVGGRPVQISLRIVELRFRGMMASFGSERTRLFGE